MQTASQAPVRWTNSIKVCRCIPPPALPQQGCVYAAIRAGRGGGRQRCPSDCLQRRRRRRARAACALHLPHHPPALRQAPLCCAAPLWPRLQRASPERAGRWWRLWCRERRYSRLPHLRDSLLCSGRRHSAVPRWAAVGAPARAAAHAAPTAEAAEEEAEAGAGHSG